jgi:hypothetical protein
MPHNIEIKGTEKFRRVVLIVSIFFSIITLFVLIGENRKCEGANLEVALWLAFSI